MISLQLESLLTVRTVGTGDLPALLALFGVIDIAWNDVLFAVSVLVSLILGAFLIMPDKLK